MSDRNREIELADEEQTMALGEAIGRTLRGGDCIALDGELAAGKTSFVRGLARALGIDPQEVSSPTFVYVHTYIGNGLRLNHADLWRLKSVDELHSLGWDELTSDPNAVLAIEWASRIPQAIPTSHIHVQLEIVHAANSADPNAEATSTRRATIHDCRQDRCATGF